MDPKFAKLVDSLAPKLKELLAMKPVRYRAIPMTLPMKGVYLLSKGNKHLYVGRSNAIRKRFHRHFTHPRGAAFAFLLAREATGKKRNYMKANGGTRQELMNDPNFRAALLTEPKRPRPAQAPPACDRGSSARFSASAPPRTSAPGSARGRSGWRPFRCLRAA